MKRRPAAARGDRPRPGDPPADHPGRRADRRPDSKTGRQILALLRALVDHEGVTLLMATHDPAAAEFATDLYQLRDGRSSSAELRHV